MVEPALFEATLEELSDQDLRRTVLSRSAVYRAAMARISEMVDELAKVTLKRH